MSGVQLSRPLLLERAVKVADGAGGFAETWEPLGQLWADLRIATGRAASGEYVAL